MPPSASHAPWLPPARHRRHRANCRHSSPGGAERARARPWYARRVLHGRGCVHGRHERGPCDSGSGGPSALEEGGGGAVCILGRAAAGAGQAPGPARDLRAPRPSSHGKEPAVNDHPPGHGDELHQPGAHSRIPCHDSRSRAPRHRHPAGLAGGGGHAAGRSGQHARPAAPGRRWCREPDLPASFGGGHSTARDCGPDRAGQERRRAGGGWAASGPGRGAVDGDAFGGGAGRRAHAGAAHDLHGLGGGLLQRQGVGQANSGGVRDAV
mmetsp:Transcript_18812/g.35834  ORF Transcript_18812/g.35834 Transcript_18812/m.35834 type:complete len:267 (+) Transcript_18812:2102-2902(+)